MERTTELTNTRKERPLFNCSEVVNSEPCKYYILKENKKQYITINPDDYKVIGQNKDAFFLVLKE